MLLKLLINKKDGSVHIREKSNESAENIEEVHPNKIRSWLGIGKASHTPANPTMEQIIQSVIDKCSGKKYKQEIETQKASVTKENYILLCKSAYKKGVSKKKLDELVTVVEQEEPQTLEEIVKAVVKKRRTIFTD